MQINLLKEYINRKVKDIYVTGYSERRIAYNFFSTMNWWYYIEFENNFLCLASNEINGILEFSIQDQIKCNFNIESEDVFTITSISKENYSEILEFDLFFGKDDLKIYALGIAFKDENYVFFDSLNWNGIKIGDKSKKDIFMQDTRFSFSKII